MNMAQRTLSVPNREIEMSQRLLSSWNMVLTKTAQKGFLYIYIYDKLW